jgi:hypothetical protein
VKWGDFHFYSSSCLSILGWLWQAGTWKLNQEPNSLDCEFYLQAENFFSVNKGCALTYDDLTLRRFIQKFFLAILSLKHLWQKG